MNTEQNIPEETRTALLQTQRKLWGEICFFPIHGRCYSCDYDLVLNLPVETLTTELVRGCPRCHRSFSG